MAEGEASGLSCASNLAPHCTSVLSETSAKFEVSRMNGLRDMRIRERLRDRQTDRYSRQAGRQKFLAFINGWKYVDLKKLLQRSKLKFNYEYKDNDT